MRRLLASLLLSLSLVGAPWGVAHAGIVEGEEAFEAGEFERAHAELLPLAGENNLLAAYYIGLMYLQGLGVMPSAETGIEWLTRAAESGHTDAQLSLAIAYDAGQSVPQDYRLAARWMTESASGGNADAQYYLGQYYRYGRGVVQDDAQAYEWIQRSVEYGVSHERLLEALLYLGAACEWGRGLRQDLTEAYKWFSLAASYSFNDARMHDEAGRAMDALRIRMSPSELAAAGRRALTWQTEKREMYGAQ
jgi:hypothetical protein